MKKRKRKANEKRGKKTGKNGSYIEAVCKICS